MFRALILAFTFAVLTLSGLTSVKAQVAVPNIPLPKHLYTLEALAEEFRGFFRADIDNLSRTYIRKTAGIKAMFFSDADVTCNGQVIPPGQPVASLLQLVQPSPVRLVESVIYVGCNGTRALTEKVTTDGQNLKPLSFAQVLSGERTFSLAPNEFHRHVGYHDKDGQEIMYVDIRRKSTDETVAFFSMNGKPALRVTETYGPKESKLMYEMRDFAFNVAATKSNSTTSWGFATTTLTITVQPNEQIYYRVNKEEPTDFKTFKERFNMAVVTAITGSMKMGLQTLRTDLPPTTFVSTGGGQSRRVVEELKLALIQLDNKDTNAVRLLINTYLKAIDLDQIKIDDRRP